MCYACVLLVLNLILCGSSVIFLICCDIPDMSMFDFGAFQLWFVFRACRDKKFEGLRLTAASCDVWQHRTSVIVCFDEYCKRFGTRYWCCVGLDYDVGFCFV
ncbi:unnamed protein product [Pylaiella littoralis]